MKPDDPILLHLAQLANVRPPHCYILWATMKHQKARFNASAFAAFCGLELRHVERMVSVFDSEGVFGDPIEKTSATRGERLPADFAVPADWLQFAQSSRFWTIDVCETVAAEFVDYWHSQPGSRAVKLDWLATWRNWVRNSRRPNGERIVQTPARIQRGDPGWREHCKQQLEYATRVNNITKIRMWRAEIDALV